MKDRNYLINFYNASSTDDGNGGIETYESWLERQLLSRIKALEILESKTSELDSFIESYLNLFPKGVRSGGKLVRSDKKGTEKKMKTFLKDYSQYSQEDILKATELYVSKFKLTNYAYMKAAIYFIGKKGEGSVLAEEIENYLSGDKVEKNDFSNITHTNESYKSLFE